MAAEVGVDGRGWGCLGERCDFIPAPEKEDRVPRLGSSAVHQE